MCRARAASAPQGAGSRGRDVLWKHGSGRHAAAWFGFVSAGASPTRSTSIEQPVVGAVIALAAATHGATSMLLPANS